MSEKMQRCDHCRKYFPQQKVASHFGYCRRNILKCKECGEMYDKNYKEEHQEQFHKREKCPHCRQEFTNEQIKAHINKCDMKKKLCQYCQLDIAIKEYPAHLKACESRTKTCDKCHKHIINKDYLVHLVSCKGPVQQPKHQAYDSYIDQQRKREKQLRQNGGRLVPSGGTDKVVYENVVNKNTNQRQIKYTSGIQQNKARQEQYNKQYKRRQEEHKRRQEGYKRKQEFQHKIQHRPQHRQQYKQQYRPQQKQQQLKSQYNNDHRLQPNKVVSKQTYAIKQQPINTTSNQRTNPSHQGKVVQNYKRSEHINNARSTDGRSKVTDGNSKPTEQIKQTYTRGCPAQQNKKQFKQPIYEQEPRQQQFNTPSYEQNKYKKAPKQDNNFLADYIPPEDDLQEITEDEKAIQKAIMESMMNTNIDVNRPSEETRRQQLAIQQQFRNKRR